MLSRTLAYLVLLAAGIEALPQSFVLDMGNSPPVPLLNTTSHVFNWPTTLQTTSLTTTTSAPVHILAANTTTTAVNSIRTCLPATTIIITLPNPTPRPTATPERNDDQSTLTDTEDATPFDTVSPELLSKWPRWFTAATFTLVFYDVLTLCVFLWLWVFGYLWWFRQGRTTRTGREELWRRSGGSQGLEMVSTDMLVVRDRHGDERYEREWMRTGRGYGRVRSESWERARSAREAELEGEMRRLGMI